jgi:hypothetical protein
MHNGDEFDIAHVHEVNVLFVLSLIITGPPELLQRHQFQSEVSSCKNNRLDP